MTRDFKILDNLYSFLLDFHLSTEILISFLFSKLMRITRHQELYIETLIIH